MRHVVRPEKWNDYRRPELENFDPSAKFRLWHFRVLPGSKDGIFSTSGKRLIVTVKLRLELGILTGFQVVRTASQAFHIPRFRSRDTEGLQLVHTPKHCLPHHLSWRARRRTVTKSSSNTWSICDRLAAYGRELQR